MAAIRRFSGGEFDIAGGEEERGAGKFGLTTETRKCVIKSPCCLQYGFVLVHGAFSQNEEAHSASSMGFEVKSLTSDLTKKRHDKISP
jgi:hypothetical protein